MSQVEKTVFISYRRTNIFSAIAIYQRLSASGYDVFFDYESIKSGDFTQIILNQIAARAHFVVLLTPSALERCNEPNDWLRREIEHAIELKRNIIPLMFDGFDFRDAEKYLKGNLRLLPKYNGLRVYSDYFSAAMERLCKEFLSIPLELVMHPSPPSEQPMVDVAQAEASSQPTPSAEKLAAEKLAAEKHFELAGKEWARNNWDGVIKECTQAIDLNPEFPAAFAKRAAAKAKIGDLLGCRDDSDSAIQLGYSDAVIYYNRGSARRNLGDIDGAIADYTEAISLNSAANRTGTRINAVYYFRAKAYLEKGDWNGAIEDCTELIRRNPKWPDHHLNRAIAYSRKGNFDEAKADLERYIKLGGDKEWANEQIAKIDATLRKKKKSG